jgi:hypothetical protein
VYQWRLSVQTDNLMLRLRNTANDLLNSDGLYPVLDYGWDGPETPSSDFVGLAMWTTDAPFEPDVNFWNRNTPPAEPTERDEIFHRSGEDFIGAMELARNAIGLTRYAWEQRSPDNVLNDDEMFWEHRAAAFIWLNIASDRVRDYFVMARFGMPTEQYKKLDKKNGIYARPFRMHSAGEGELARKAALELERLVERLGGFRRTRNEIVHSIASRQGSNAVLSLSRQREEARRRPVAENVFGTATLTLECGRDAIRTVEQAKQQKLSDALQQLREWYLLLVRVSSAVFEFEYWKRINR